MSAVFYEPCGQLSTMRPTGNLDSTTGRQVIDLILSLNRDHGSTLVLVTHDPDLAKHAERIITLRDGRIESDRSMTVIA